jgi:hypothetical protein
LKRGNPREAGGEINMEALSRFVSSRSSKACLKRGIEISVCIEELHAKKNSRYRFRCDFAPEFLFLA